MRIPILQNAGVGAANALPNQSATQAQTSQQSGQNQAQVRQEAAQRNTEKADGKHRAVKVPKRTEGNFESQEERAKAGKFADEEHKEAEQVFQQIDLKV